MSGRATTERKRRRLETIHERVADPSELTSIVPTSALASAGADGKLSSKPPQQAYEACKDKTAGGEVTITISNGHTFKAVCRQVGDEFAAPERLPGKGSLPGTPVPKSLIRGVTNPAGSLGSLRTVWAPPVPARHEPVERLSKGCHPHALSSTHPAKETD